MQRLSVKLQLACGERSFDELRLQRRIWRHIVHSGQVNRDYST
jgi:hypothetical protein